MAALVASLCFAPPAYAYIDGGTASMIFQMSIAALVASSFFLRTWWGRAKSFVMSVLGKESASGETSAEDSPSVDD